MLQGGTIEGLPFYPNRRRKSLNLTRLFYFFDEWQTEETGDCRNDDQPFQSDKRQEGRSGEIAGDHGEIIHAAQERERGRFQSGNGIARHEIHGHDKNEHSQETIEHVVDYRGHRRIIEITRRSYRPYEHRPEQPLLDIQPAAELIIKQRADDPEDRADRPQRAYPDLPPAKGIPLDKK